MGKAGYTVGVVAWALTIGLVGGGCTTPATATKGASPSPSPTKVAPIPVGSARVLHPETGVDLHRAGLASVQDLDPAKAHIATPHVDLGLDLVATATTLNQAQLNSLGFNAENQPGPGVVGPLTADPGHEFLFTEVKGNVATQSGGARVVIRVGDQETPPINDDGLYPHALIVSQVPAGGEAFIVIDDSGQKPSLSLRTGKPGGPAPAYAARRDTLEFAMDIQADGFGQIRIALYVSLTQQRYDTTRGWAPDGHAWLNVAVDLLLDTKDLLAHVGFARLVQLHRQDGTAVGLPSSTLDTTVGTPLSAGSHDETVDVPSSTTAYRYTLQLPVTLTTTASGAAVNYHAITATSITGTTTLS
jgi:hypothetical protein